MDTGSGKTHVYVLLYQGSVFWTKLTSFPHGLPSGLPSGLPDYMLIRACRAILRILTMLENTPPGKVCTSVCHQALYV